MNATTKDEAAAIARPTGLALLREAVPEHLISPLPKGTKAQNECPAEQKINCTVCGGWHHPKVRHLSYVGHAAATHLLLEADEKWNWEPLAFTDRGLPAFDEVGGLWIKLTVCDVTRLGYGNADAKAQMDKGSREKEVIGDALRNAAMRFGLALELWSKADLHADVLDADPPPKADDDEFMGLLGEGRDVSLEGMKKLTEWWGKLTTKQRSEMSKDFPALRRAAQEVDKAVPHA